VALIFRSHTIVLVDLKINVNLVVIEVWKKLYVIYKFLNIVILSNCCENSIITLEKKLVDFAKLLCNLSKNFI
jgi:hypothetical protein